MQPCSPVVYVSATPGDYEMEQETDTVIEQIIHQQVFGSKWKCANMGQIDDLLGEINARVERTSVPLLLP